MTSSKSHMPWTVIQPTTTTSSDKEVQLLDWQWPFSGNSCNDSLRNFWALLVPACYLLLFLSVYIPAWFPISVLLSVVLLASQAEAFFPSHASMRHCCGWGYATPLHVGSCHCWSSTSVYRQHAKWQMVERQLVNDVNQLVICFLLVNLLRIRRCVPTLNTLLRILTINLTLMPNTWTLCYYS